MENPFTITLHTIDASSNFRNPLYCLEDLKNLNLLNRHSKLEIVLLQITHSVGGGIVGVVAGYRAGHAIYLKLGIMFNFLFAGTNGSIGNV